MPVLHSARPLLRAWMADNSVGVALAVRAAVAAVLAWLIGLPLGGVADDYLYYAPFGAVVAVSTTVMNSVRTSVQTFLAIALGAVVAIGVQLLGLPSPLGLGVVVLIGTLISQRRWLGANGSLVPIAGLFVLVLGQGDEETFVLGYLGLTTLGALVGTAVNMAFPPLLLNQTERAQDALRRALVEQLEQLASAVDGGVLPDPADAGAVAGALLGHGRAVEDLAGQALEGPPVNWRMRRSRLRADHLRDQGTALVSLALLVGDLAHTLRRREGPDNEEETFVRLNLHVQTAEALRATALTLSAEADDPKEALATARLQIDELAEAVRRAREAEGTDLFASGALVLGLRSALPTAPTD